jgi:hypothetical protein
MLCAMELLQNFVKKEFVYSKPSFSSSCFEKHYVEASSAAFRFHASSSSASSKSSDVSSICAPHRAR